MGSEQLPYIHIFRRPSGIMETVNATQFRKDLFSILDRTIQGNGKCIVTTKSGNAVVISEEAWNSLMETLYILSDPDMLSSIEKAEEEYPEGSVEWRQCLRDIA